MDLKLSGKAAIVTGGAKGIGLEISRTLLQEGCRVCMVGTDHAALERAEREFSVLGPCMARVCDVTDARGNVTAHRTPKTASASKTPFPPNEAVKQQTENDNEKPNAAVKHGSSATPMDANPRRTAKSG